MSVLLYLMRHGAAEDSAPTGRDADRALTAYGREVVERVALALRRVQPAALGRIIASPYIRARQTAEVMRSVLAPTLLIEEDYELAPDDSAYDLAARLGAMSEPVPTLLVGHQPNIEAVARALVAPGGRGIVGAGGRGIVGAGGGAPEGLPPRSVRAQPPAQAPRFPAGFRTATLVGFRLEGRPPPFALAVALDPTNLDDHG